MRSVLAAMLAVLVVSVAPSTGSVSGAVTVTAVLRQSFDDGDRTTSIKQIRDRHGNVIGWGNTVCLDLHNSSEQCVGTFVLPLGKINVAGTRHNQDFFVLSVVGGTGLYVGAGGSLVGNLVAPRRERLVFFLQ